MKSWILLSGMAMAIISCVAKARQSPAHYKEFLSGHIEQIQQYFFEVHQNFADSGSGYVQYKVQQINGLVKEMRQQPAYDTNKTYKAAAVLLATYYTASAGKYKELLKLYARPDSVAADAAIDKILGDIQDGETKLEENYHTQQNNFLVRYKLPLQDSLNIE